MPEYLAPGVYVEEVSFRSKSIEGVSTSTAGFVGPTRYGPDEGEPELLTNFGDFERIYGGIDSLDFDNETGESINYMAHAVRAFFDNGGSRLYVSRVFQPINSTTNTGKATRNVGPGNEITLNARFPGSAGNMRIIFAVKASGNQLSGTTNERLAKAVRANEVVYIHTDSNITITGNTFEGFYDVAGTGASRTFTST